MRRIAIDTLLALSAVFIAQGAQAENSDRWWEKQFTVRPPQYYVQPGYIPRPDIRQKKATVPVIPPETKDPVGPMRLDPVPLTTKIPGKVVVLFIDLQQFVTYQDGVIASYDGKFLLGAVSTGTPKHSTPLTDPKKGPHTVGHRQVDYVSITYPEPDGGAPMPYAQFFRDDGIAIHAGYVDITSRAKRLNHGLSHGCVRLVPSQAKSLYNFNADKTMKVIVVRDVEDLHINWELGYFAELARAKEQAQKALDLQQAPTQTLVPQ